MKTLEQIRDGIKSESIEAAFPDGRNIARLVDFFPPSEWESLGFKASEDADLSEFPKPLDEATVKARLAADLEFAFEKALNKRGISAGAMYEVVKTWLWLLDDELQDFGDYAQYGLPLFKAVAIKYGLPNPIGDDEGSEGKYSEYA